MFNSGLDCEAYALGNGKHNNNHKIKLRWVIVVKGLIKGLINCLINRKVKGGVNI